MAYQVVAVFDLQVNSESRETDAAALQRFLAQCLEGLTFDVPTSTINPRYIEAQIKGVELLVLKHADRLTIKSVKP